MVLGQCHALKPASEATNSTTIADESQCVSPSTVNFSYWIALYNETVKSSACENFS
jgi:hypothetical protein